MPTGSDTKTKFQQSILTLEYSNIEIQPGNNRSNMSFPLCAQENVWILVKKWHPYSYLWCSCAAGYLVRHRILNPHKLRFISQVVSSPGDCGGICLCFWSLSHNIAGWVMLNTQKFLMASSTPLPRRWLNCNGSWKVSFRLFRCTTEILFRTFMMCVRATGL